MQQRSTLVTLPTQRVRPAVVPPGRQAAPPSWPRRYARTVQATDLAIVSAVVGIGILAGLGAGDAADHARAFAGGIAWLLLAGAFTAFRVWEPQVLGSGPREFQRLFRATLAAVIALGLGGLALHLESVRLWVFGLVPLAAALCALARRALRTRLYRERAAGRCLRRVLAVGTEEGIADLVLRTRRDPGFGWRITAACTSTGTGTVEGVPVVGDLDAVAQCAAAADVVAVGPAPGWGPARLQQLAWDIEDSGTALAVHPGLTEIAGPRLHITPVDGVPLLRLTRPRLTGGTRLVKEIVDRAGSLTLLVLLAPALLGIAAAVALSGPVLVRRQRIGLGGRPFAVYKFRTTVDGVPTRGGGFLRRRGLDQLPKLVTVLGGSMSLVGPRALYPDEVLGFGNDARRRLLVKPGLTGLEQVSGPGELTPEEAVRLDLRYVENWSATLDIAIMWRTAGAVLRGR